MQVPVLSSSGGITTKPPYFLGLWNKPVLKFSLSFPNAMKGKWSIDENLGVMKGHLGDKEEVSFTVTAEDQFHRKDARQIHIKAK